MEQQQKKQNVEQDVQGSSSTTTSTPVSTQEGQEDEEKTFGDMSVDELNTLSPEQRRDQMLQALERRTSSS